MVLQRFQKIVIFLLCTAVFFTSFQWNLLSVADQKQFIEFQRDSESLVLGTIMQIRHHGIFSQAGLLGRVDTELDYWDQAVEKQYAYFTADTVGTDYVRYISQSGGQGFLYAGVDRVFWWLEPAQRLELLHGVNSLLTAIVFSGFIVWVFSEFGLFVSIFVGLCLLVSGDVALFGRNLYWVIWILYAPMVIGLLTLGSDRIAGWSNRKKAYWLFSGFLFALLTKYLLNGFEYIFAFLVMTLLPSIYYSLRDHWSWQMIGGAIALFTLSIGTITPLAYLLVSAQIGWAEQTSVLAGADALLGRYELHTGITTLDTMSGLEVIGRYLMHAPFSHLRWLHNLNMAYIIAGTTALITLLQTSLFMHARSWSQMKTARMQALSMTTALSLLGPISFFLIFKVHAQIHGHIDFITWYFPFLLFVFILLGSCLQALLERFGFFNFHRFDD